MSGYPYGGNPPQYPPPQNQIYPQIYNPANAPPPGQPTVTAFPAGGFLPQPGFAYPYPSQPQQAHPAAMSYAGIMPTAPLQAAQPAPNYGFPGYGQPPAYTSNIEWIPTTPQNAHTLSERALVGGYEGHDGSPLWVIRARFERDLIPGKMAIKHRCAYVPWGGRENPVNNIEVCCVRPDKVRWVESRDNVIPPNAIVAGNTSAGEPLYVGRAKQQGSLTPGKVHPSHKTLYIPFGGQEVAHKVYEILCSA